MSRLHVTSALALAGALAGGFLIAQPASSSPAPLKPGAAATPLPTSAPGENIGLTVRAMAEFSALQSGKIDRSHYAKVANDALGDLILSDLSKQLKAYGPARTIIYRGKKNVGAGSTDYYYTLDCEKGALAMTLDLDANDKVAGLSVGPE
jgi:hypothetical protein